MKGPRRNYYLIMWDGTIFDKTFVDVNKMEDTINASSRLVIKQNGPYLMKYLKLHTIL